MRNRQDVMTAGIILDIRTPPSVPSIEARRVAWDKLATDFLTPLTPHGDTSAIDRFHGTRRCQASPLDIEIADGLQWL